MYIINHLSLQVVETLFIHASRYRTAQNMVGLKDGSNLVFTTPTQERYLHNLPFFSIALFYNGVRLSLLDDYMVVESGGLGTGFDTVVLYEAPFSNDHLLADYVTA